MMPVQVVGAMVGAAMVVAGLMLVAARRGPSPPGARLSTPTRLAIGISLILVGYHVASWSLPDGYLPLRVPIDRWWIVAAAAAAALLGSAAADRLEGAGDGGEGS